MGVDCKQGAGADAGEDRIPRASPEAGRVAAGAEPAHQGLAVVLARMMDAVPAELVLCTPAGSILHANRPARMRLDADSGRKSLGEEIRYLCVALHLQIAEKAGEDGTEAASHVERRVRLDGSEVRLRAIDLGVPRQGRSPAILVLLDFQDPFSDQELKQRGLTGAEIRIARLVMRGTTNREIAHALSVSIHTVRHHVQHIRDKVGVHSRTQLMETFRIAAPRTATPASADHARLQRS